MAKKQNKKQNKPEVDNKVDNSKPEKTKHQLFIEDWKGKIKYLENIAKAIYQKKVVVDKVSGTVDVGLSTADLKNLADTERAIIRMKKDLKQYEERSIDPEREDDDEEFYDDFLFDDDDGFEDLD